MDYRACNNKIILRIDKGEEIVSTLNDLCSKLNIKTAFISGIGACDRGTIGFLDLQTKEYLKYEFEEEFEITSLIGNITRKDEKPYIHLHINLSNKDMQTFGGHLNEAYISATCEILIDIIDIDVDRQIDEDLNLNIFKF
ncbi:MAG: DNA-binding protein [Peptostreptococcaceae bacterium]|jgi:predicted DNA-binding protein with PD1-like motif|nr:DNA-binding protein [Peptostreptococcaceae bacterium]